MGNNDAIGFSISDASIDDPSATSQKYRVSGAGDFDADGFDDVIIAGDKSHNSYLVYGSEEKSTSVDLSNGIDALLIEDDFCDKHVSNAGDINGDGFDDLIIGSPDAVNSSGDPTGISYLLFGRSDPFSPMTLSISAAPKIVGTADEDNSGKNVSTAGDIDGDGYSDFIIGSKNLSEHVKSYVIYGNENAEDINLLTIDQGSDYDKGFTIFDNTHNSSWDGATTGAGDINHDGYDDIIIGADGADNSYIVYGGPREHDLVANGLNTSKQFGDTGLVGHRTDDDLTWNGSSAVLIGGAGDDTLTIDNKDFNRIDGGSGTDTLIFNTDMNLDFSTTTVKKTAIKDIEKFDLGVLLVR